MSFRGVYNRSLGLPARAGPRKYPLPYLTLRVSVLSNTFRRYYFDPHWYLALKTRIDALGRQHAVVVSPHTHDSAAGGFIPLDQQVPRIYWPDMPARSAQRLFAHGELRSPAMWGDLHEERPFRYVPRVLGGQLGRYDPRYGENIPRSTLGPGVRRRYPQPGRKEMYYNRRQASPLFKSYYEVAKRLRK